MMDSSGSAAKIQAVNPVADYGFLASWIIG